MKKMSPREIRRLMQRMGMELEEMQGVEKVVIIMSGKNIVIQSPQIMVMKIGGQKVYQITGEEKEEQVKMEIKMEIPEEDVQLVASQTGVSMEEARRALEATKGDLAQAIILLTSKSS
ncbi:MAG: nascent polypeptide-associated complex protein [Candidatus Methanomethyliaceae archaeon]|nr:nascent polypeptide-associated complex protein [Candidatus Methanomethyliaceae archaeon]MDW7970248.1 nascent polypeptide-associated complex protein [Nitrososphaerota archaeon]